METLTVAARVRASSFVPGVIAVLAVAAAGAGCAAARGNVGQYTLPTSDPPTSATVKPEYRAVWVTTAYNNDWPSKPALHRRVQQDEMNAIIARAKDLNCNLIFLQVRAFGDRIYGRTSLVADSEKNALENPGAAVYQKEPWAQALNYDNDPGYDPFDAWVQACAAAGIELHAWINPYRVNKLVKVTINKVEYYLPVIKWEKQLYLDPRSGEVQKYVQAVIADFLKNYPPESNVFYLHEAGSKRAMMLASGDGSGGAVYDHQIPEPPDKEGPPTTRPASTSPSADARVRFMTTVPTAAEKRVDWLIKVYKDHPQMHLPNDTNGSVKALLDWSYDAVSGAGGRFGLSPQATGAHDYTSPQIADKKVDYIVPELYTRKPSADFRVDLRRWLDKIPDDSIAVIGGLNTARVQLPAGMTSDDTWLAEDILQQMDDVAAVEGLKNKRKAVGVAHFSASALRLADQGGPEEKRNIGKKLKEGKYKQAKLPPPHAAAPGVAPDAPKDFGLDNRPGDGEYVTWKKGSGRPRLWQVWVWRESRKGWDDVEVIGGDRTEYKIDADVGAVWVKSVDRFNRPSTDYGKWNR